MRSEELTEEMQFDVVLVTVGPKSVLHMHICMYTIYKTYKIILEQVFF